MRDDFSPKTKELVAKRAAYICSKPDCRNQTLGPSEADPGRFIFLGEVAHITAAAKGGPRYDPNLTEEQRASPDNGILLCPTCAALVDKNGGVDYPVETLRRWKAEHEEWARQNLNQNVQTPFPVVNGVHFASGTGDVTALDIEGPVLLRPGTKSVAQGSGTVTATRIRG
jgi:hypothetical protein